MFYINLFLIISFNEINMLLETKYIYNYVMMVKTLLINNFRFDI